MKNLSKVILGVVGLGYVGLPLAIAFSKKYKTIGFDVNTNRVDELIKGIDKTFEVEKKELKLNKVLFTNNYKKLNSCNVYIVTVPTPILKNKLPDMSFLSSASKLVAKVLKKGDLVIFESTVYPGATEDFCVPILEKHSKLSFNEDFYCGYSPERINPGDKKHRIQNIKKVTSGSTPSIRNFVEKLYASIITAGTYSAESIRVAEAAKVIENTQRDVNIALINELAILFNKMGISTNEVLTAANTKWNFLNFKPGLVGGHCIGVDPFYLTYKAKQVGYKPKIILAGRKLNDDMAAYVANEISKLIKLKKLSKKPRILVLGMTFKENCPDIRNSQVLRMIKKFNQMKYTVDVLDPYVDPNLKFKNLNFKLINKPQQNRYDVILGAVAHSYFKKLSSKKVSNYLKKKSVVYDIKNFLPKEIVTRTL